MNYRSLTAIILFTLSSLFVVDGLAQRPSRSEPVGRVRSVADMATPTTTPTQPGTKRPAAESDVVRISTELVQVDAVVTDKDGRQVTDLTVNDFQIFQDGKPQTLESVTYVDRSDPTGQRILQQTFRSGRSAPPPVKLKRATMGRVVAFLVDDGNCKSSSVGMAAAREGIQKFIREQMLPTDRVAIFRTRGGSSVLQQFTNDKERLLTLASKIRWLPPQGNCESFNGDFREKVVDNEMSRNTPGGFSSTMLESPAERASREAREDSTQSSQLVGAIGVASYIVNGLSRIPGRKVMFLISDGLPLVTQNRRMMNSTPILRELTELANRSAVVINTIHDRGVDAPLFEARDEVSMYLPTARNGIKVIESADRRAQDGLAFIANETGGRFYRSSNSLDAPIEQAMQQERGFYLLAYEPDGDSFKGKNFNSIEVKVTRPELKVASRAGFYGIADQDLATGLPTGKNEFSPLYAALVAPMEEAGLTLDLTAYFVNDGARGDIVRTLTHVEGSDLKFEDAPNGQKRLLLDAVAVTMNEKNQVIDEFTRTHELKFDARAVPLIQRNGLTYTADIPVKKPGSYNVRVAIRDGQNRRIGSASDVLEVPDLKNRDLFLSGLVLTQTDTQGKFEVPAAAAAETAVALPASGAVPAIRQFSPGSVLAYAYTIYNAKLDPLTGQPKLSIQTNLYKDGVLISKGDPVAADIQKQADMTRIQDYTYLRLDPKAEPGSYTLQVIVTDLLNSGKDAVSSQWIDFEVVK